MIEWGSAHGIILGSAPAGHLSSGMFLMMRLSGEPRLSVKSSGESAHVMKECSQICLKRW